MYEIRVLENEDFDELPYKKARSSLGLADAKTGVAYVRRTGINGLDATTIRHEFDELLQKVSPHEEDGIRYKSGASLGSWLGPVIGTAISVLSGGTLTPLGVAVGGGISGGTKYHTQATKPEKYGSPTFGSVATSTGMGALGSYAGGSLANAGISGFKAAGPGFMSKLGGTLSGMTGGAIGAGPGAAPTSIATPSGYTGTVTVPGIGSSIPISQASTAASGGGASLGSAISSGINKASKGFTPTSISSAGSKAIEAAPSLLSKTGGLAKKAATGLATDTLVNSLSPTQNRAVANLGQSGGENALSLFGAPNKLSSSNPSSAFKAPYGDEEVNQGLLNIDQQYQKQYRNIFDTFRQAAPGTSIEGNSRFASQLANAKKGYGATIDSFTQGVDTANVQAQNQYVYNGVKNANNLSDAQMSQYIRLSSQPDSVIRAQFPGMQPSEFRSIFQGLEAFA